MVNINLKDSKMGCNPHSNPRDEDKSPKVVVRLKKLDTPHFPKKIIHRNFGDNRKNREMLNENQALHLEHLRTKTHPLLSSQQCPCSLAGMQLVNDNKWLYRATFKMFLLDQSLGYEDSSSPLRLVTASSKGSKV